MSKKIYVAFILTVLLVLPSVVSAPITFLPGGEFTWPKMENFWKLAFGPGVPDYMVQSPYHVLQFLIFPFLSLWVIIYGILEQIRIFRRKSWLHGILALLIAAISGPTGGLVWAVRVVFVAYGWFGFAIFAALLFIGTALWGWGTFRLWKPSKDVSWGRAAADMKTDIELQEQMRKLERIIHSPSKKVTEEMRKDALEDWKRLAGKREREFGEE